MATTTAVIACAFTTALEIIADRRPLQDPHSAALTTEVPSDLTQEGPCQTASINDLNVSSLSAPADTEQALTGEINSSRAHSDSVALADGRVRAADISSHMFFI